MIQGSSITEILSTDIEKVEVYDQKDWGKFGKYAYIVIYTIDQQQLLITQFTVPGLLLDRTLESFLRKKPRVYFKKALNFINESQFKPFF